MKTLNRIVVVAVLSAVVLATGVLSTGVANAKLDLTSEGVRVAAIKFRSRVTTTSSSQSMTCATGAKCVLGDIGPGGGQVFYVADGLSFFTSVGSICNTKCKYLEAAPVSWSTNTQKPKQTICVTPGNATTDPKCVWSGVTAKLIGLSAQGIEIGTGYANTSAIIAQSNIAGKAATAARGYQGGGFVDWFLPSQLELNQLCRYAQNLEVDTGTTSCVRGELRSGFSADYYWSSSESIRPYPARFQSFNTGAQITSSKFYAFYVRPVRAFG